MKKFLLLILFSGLFNFLFASWKISNSTDKMTGDKSSYTISTSVKATERMNFPYQDIDVSIGIGCNKKSSWIYLVFSDAPNLSNTKTKDGYSLIKTRVKYDDKIEITTMTQDWGSRFIHFLYEEEVINKIKTSKKMLVELDWYGNGSTYFKFNLNGIDKAINSIYDSCGYTPKQEVKKTIEKQDTIKTEVKPISNEIPLTSITLKERKQECAEKGGGNDWDFKKDIFICVKKPATIKTEVKPISNAEIPLKSNTLAEQKKECLEVGGKYDWDFKKDIFRCIGK